MEEVGALVMAWAGGEAWGADRVLATAAEMDLVMAWGIAMVMDRALVMGRAGTVLVTALAMVIALALALAMAMAKATVCDKYIEN